MKDDRLENFADQFFQLRQRKGVSKSIAMESMRNNNYFGAMLLKNEHVDGMLNGLIEPYAASVKPILETLGTIGDHALSGTQMISYKKKLYFFSDCTINVSPNAEQMAHIAYHTAQIAKEYTEDTIRLAFLSFSSYGSNRHPITGKISDACHLLEAMNPDFQFDGEIQADVALNDELRRTEFPFANIDGQANVLIFPDLMSANISYKILANLTDASSFGPILRGPTKPAHVLERGASVEEVINMIYLTANQWARC